MTSFDKLKDQIEMTITSEGLRIELMETERGTFFPSGVPDPSEDGKQILTMLANELGQIPNTVSIAFEFVEGELILLYLSEKGICASSGSACTSGSLEPSHVLRAMGVPFTCAHGSIRFSLSRFNTDEEVDFVISELPHIIRRGREMSPFGREFLASGN